MFIVIVDGIDASSHSLEIDATTQKQRFEAMGMPNVTLEEKDTFSPSND